MSTFFNLPKSLGLKKKSVHKIRRTFTMLKKVSFFRVPKYIFFSRALRPFLNDNSKKRNHKLSDATVT